MSDRSPTVSAPAATAPAPTPLPHRDTRSFDVWRGDGTGGRFERYDTTMPSSTLVS